MSHLGMLAMFARELIARGQQPRGQPPSAQLGSQRIMSAMEHGGAVDGRTAAGYLYHSARITQTIVGSKLCVDLGCGTGVQLLQVAALNPTTRFIGIDREPATLTIGAARAAQLGLTNIEWMVADLTNPLRVGREIDAAISTMCLHDLPDLAALDALLANMREMVGPQGAIYIEDFARLRCSRSIDFFVDLNAPVPPDEFAALYRCSLNAAFSLYELKAVCAKLPAARLYSTFLVPFLIVVKTADRPLATDTRARFHAMRENLAAQYRRDLDDLRRFFALGGLGNDPFA